jgi:raffinose/stachyose/melibiose transport system permease protein
VTVESGTTAVAERARPRSGDRRPERRVARRSGRRSSPPGEPRKLAYLYILPAVAVFIAFVGVPLGRTVSLSLYDWDGLSDKVWAGAANYREVFTDPELRGAFVHALVLIVFYAVIPVVLGTMIAATMMRARRLRGLGFFRVVIFLPQVVPMVVVAIAWRQIYQPDGPLNSLFGSSGSTAWRGRGSATTRGRCRRSAWSAPG